MKKTINTQIKIEIYMLLLPILFYGLQATLFANEKKELALREFKGCKECPEMVVLPKGEYLMGVISHDKHKLPFYLPVRKVTINYHLAVGKTELLSSEYYQCYLDSECKPLNAKYDGQGNPIFVPDQSKLDLPANAITWDMAHDYLKWLSEKTGRKYRLLSESEWEYAARGGTDTEYWWGDKFKPEMAVTSETVISANGGVSANRMKPNPFGLFGTLGNINEWVEDCKNINAGNLPNDGSPNIENADCNFHVSKGGGYNTGSLLAISSARRFFKTKYKPINWIGFRIATDEISENNKLDSP